jgi:nitrate reductase molybdenum cofactor assembly chaperone NarJ/NarW
MMLTYRVLAALLAYPEAETVAALDEVEQIIVREGLVPPHRRAVLAELFESMRAGDLLDLQERYVALFDRRRSVSLHLYEHVHGESRDRGQAMVRLAQLYRLHGLEIAARELPDYLPLYLEFLSVLPPAAVPRFLTEAMPIVAAIGERLRAWQSPYAAVFEALVAIANAPASAIVLPDDDEDAAALDREWEEQEVSFMGPSTAGAEACSPFRAAASRGVG